MKLHILLIVLIILTIPSCKVGCTNDEAIDYDPNAKKDKGCNYGNVDFHINSPKDHSIFTIDTVGFVEIPIKIMFYHPVAIEYGEVKIINQTNSNIEFSYKYSPTTRMDTVLIDTIFLADTSFKKYHFNYKGMSIGERTGGESYTRFTLE